jgi:hypothetical protein
MYRLTMVIMLRITLFAPDNLYPRDDGRFADSPLNLPFWAIAKLPELLHKP